MEKKEILYLSAAHVQAVLNRKDVIDTVEKVFCQAGEESIVLGQNSFLSTGDGKQNRFIAMPVSIPREKVLGLQWINIYNQPAKGYPFSHGNLVLVNDTETGSPLAVVSATDITTMRTAGGHGVIGARCLTKRNPGVLAVIGCGSQGRSGVGGFLEEFKTLEEIRLYDAYPAACEAITQMYGGSGVRFTVCASPKEAVEGCDILMTCSSSREILVEKDWIKPGMTVVAINGFQDIDPEVARLADKWVLGVRQEDLLHYTTGSDLTHGVKLDESLVYADVPELLSGKKAGRENDGEILVYSHMGMGAFDVACANIAYKRAKEKGIGVRLEV